jgi:hypothetical protein
MDSIDLAYGRIRPGDAPAGPPHGYGPSLLPSDPSALLFGRHP